MCYMNMKKTYQNTIVEILSVESFAMMIPPSGPDDPHSAPRHHWRPGPGASYDPQGSVVQTGNLERRNARTVVF